MIKFQLSVVWGEKWHLQSMIFTIYGSIGTLIILLIIIYFTRAKSRRISGALARGLAAGLLIILTDFTAYSFGLWH